MDGTANQPKRTQPGRSRAETKAEITNSIARRIIEAEAKARDAKTEKIRKARLEHEARATKAAPGASRGKKTLKRHRETAN